MAHAQPSMTAAQVSLPLLESQGSLQLSHWLRVLWDVAPPLYFDAEAPFITSRTVHLPPRRHWLEHCAAATHAVAHLVYSPTRFDGTGMAPIARALMALLEDARVETLACRELPGLTRLWRPLHTATPNDGTSFEALMRRLARALADPAYDDPHPWVAKGRKLFFLDAELGMPALRTPAELRSAAMRLGHDIGQMRLQFNAKTYRPEPSFRDDHRWMWGADDLSEVEPPPMPAPSDASGVDDDTPDDSDALVMHHPEWDRLINRLRPDWTTVIEQALSAPATGIDQIDPPGGDSTSRLLGKRLVRPLQALNRKGSTRRRSSEGEIFDLDALVDRSVARRMRTTGDSRVYKRKQPQAERAAVWLLVDQSASTAAAYGKPGDDRSILDAAVEAATAAATALHAIGIDCVVAGFNSNGRHQMRIKSARFTGQADDLSARLKSLRPEGSTRLGAAIRHATARLARHRAPARWLFVVSDGQPHDIDVHDGRYLVEDARHAVKAAARRSVRVACLELDPHVGGDDDGAASVRGRQDVRRIFGARGACTVANLQSLPAVVQRLVER